MQRPRGNKYLFESNKQNFKCSVTLLSRARVELCDIDFAAQGQCASNSLTPTLLTGTKDVCVGGYRVTFQITVCMSDFFYQLTKGKLLTDKKNTDNFIGARLVSTISCNHISGLSENRKSKGGNAPKGAPVSAHALHESVGKFVVIS